MTLPADEWAVVTLASGHWDNFNVDRVLLVPRHLVERYNDRARALGAHIVTSKASRVSYADIEAVSDPFGEPAPSQLAALATEADRELRGVGCEPPRLQLWRPDPWVLHA